MSFDVERQDLTPILLAIVSEVTHFKAPATLPRRFAEKLLGEGRTINA